MLKNSSWFGFRFPTIPITDFLCHKIFSLAESWKFRVFKACCLSNPIGCHMVGDFHVPFPRVVAGTRLVSSNFPYFSFFFLFSLSGFVSPRNKNSTFVVCPSFFFFLSFRRKTLNTVIFRSAFPTKKEMVYWRQNVNFVVNTWLNF